jgi:hypothetical protein
MNAQRLTIRAPAGRLRIVAVWRSLTQSGAHVYGWTVRVDPATGNECMTIDVDGYSEEALSRLAVALGGSPLDTTVTACMLSTPGGASDDE